MSRRSFYGLTSLMLIAFGILLMLGHWQWQRAAWKVDLIETISKRNAQTPEALPNIAEWPRLSLEQNEFRQYRLRGKFLHENERHVFAGQSGNLQASSGAAMGNIAAGPGYYILTPFLLESGELIVINRGFVPELKKAATTRIAGQMTGTLEIIAALRQPEKRNWFDGASDLQKNIYYIRDPAQLYGAGDKLSTTRFYFELRNPAPEGGYPQPNEPRINLPNNHLSYAFTWWGLAATLLGVYFAFLLAGRKRAQNNGAASRSN